MSLTTGNSLLFFHSALKPLSGFGETFLYWIEVTPEITGSGIKTIFWVLAEARFLIFCFEVYPHADFSLFTFFFLLTFSYETALCVVLVADFKALSASFWVFILRA